MTLTRLSWSYPSPLRSGLGINLVSANKVVIFDPNWNPSHDMQAMDRAFRIGQRRDVEVYRFVSSNTVEEKVYQRQLYKHGQEGLVLHQRYQSPDESQ